MFLLLAAAFPAGAGAGAGVGTGTGAQQGVQQGALYSEADVASAVDEAVLAAATRWKDKLKASEAAALTRIEAQRERIRGLQQQASASEAARLKVVREIEALQRDVKAQTRSLLDEIARREDQIARLLNAFRRDIAELAETAEGRAALALYNEDRVVESDALIAQLDRQELAAKQLGLKLEEAARLRRRARLIIPKIGEGGATTSMAIQLLEQAVERDPDFQPDWIDLTRLYTDQHQNAKARAAAARASALASDPLQKFGAQVAVTFGGKPTGLNEAIAALTAPLQQMLTLLEGQPQLAAKVPDEIGLLRKFTAALACGTPDRLRDCFLTESQALVEMADAYNRKPEAQRLLGSVWPAYARLLVASFYLEKNDPRADGQLLAIADSLRTTNSRYNDHLESLDLLTYTYRELAAERIRTGKNAEAHAAYIQALAYSARMMELDPTLVSAKLQHGRNLVSLVFANFLNGNIDAGLDRFSEARKHLGALYEETRILEARQAMWNSMALVALITRDDVIARELMADLDEADARGQLSAFHKKLLADLRRDQAASTGAFAAQPPGSPRPR